MHFSKFPLFLKYVIPMLFIVLVMTMSAPTRGQGTNFDLMGGLNLEYDGMLELNFDETTREISSLKVDNNVKLKIPSSDLKLDCDLLMLDGKSNILIATGKKVVMEAQGNYATCQRLEYHLDEGKFILTGKKPMVIQKAQDGSTMKMESDGKKGITLINKNGMIEVLSDKGTITIEPAAGAGALSGNKTGSNAASKNSNTPSPTPTPEPTPRKTPEPSGSSGGGKSPTVSE